MPNNKQVVQGGSIVITLMSLFEAVLWLGKGMGWWHLDNDQTQMWVTVARASFNAITTMLTAWWVGRKTTSLSDPQDIDQTALVREDTHGPTIYQQKASLERSIKR